MTTIGSLSRSLSPQPTVKCSTCGADVNLAKLADHTCSSIENVTQTPLTEEPLEMDEEQHVALPHRGASLYQRHRPTLPKLDSNVPTKMGRELDRREAANIAHGLGLPSPVSAGSGRRSPRPQLPRKASSPRIPLAPPSPELPISQDCAFPPFPTNKPKRTATSKETPGSKPRSTSRANTHDAVLSHSTSSSLYSSSSTGPLKSRTSDTSSYQRSRQGTITGASSPPSTAPSSPRRSLEHLDEVEKPMETYQVASHDRENAGFTPPPSALSDSTFSIPNMSTNSRSPERHHYDDVDHEVKAHTSQDERTQLDTGSNTAVTFDKMLPSVEPDNLLTPDEPSYKSKRPPALDQLASIPPERQFAAVNIKSPTTPMTAGLSRTLTNLFSRKRSQSVSSKKAAKFDVNSPRMKALAPEPPPVPPRDNGEFGAPGTESDSYFSPKVAASQTPATSTRVAVSPLTAMEEAIATSEVDTRNRDVVSPLNTEDLGSSGAYNMNEKDSKSTNEVDFDFRFGSDRSQKADESTPISTDSEYPDMAVNSSSNPDARPEIALQRASIDSASSYGSVRFSQHTISTRSSPPPSDELRNKISNALRASTMSIDIPEASRPLDEHSSPDLRRETTGSPRRLSPVLEASSRGWSQALQDFSPTENMQAIAEPDAKLRAENTHSSLSRRPTIPAANKGICRGCSTVIQLGQKSVMSKDGRLSGRYHKECFGCQTCKQSFVTADFYVYDDHPYCAHHYHVLNDTLCTSCGDGIEGQYFETTDVTGQELKKFHPKCLVCATCRVQLKDDYFEFQGHVYCERDAFRAANGPSRSVYDNAPSRPSPLNREYFSSGEPNTKGRFPERRTTKLMMT